MSFEYIRDAYGVPAEALRRVTCYGKPGVIMKAMGARIGVLIDGDANVRPYHPTHEVVYGEIAPTPQVHEAPLREWRCLPPWADDWHFDRDQSFTVQAATRSKARYRAYRYLVDGCEYMIEPGALCYIKVQAVN